MMKLHTVVGNTSMYPSAFVGISFFIFSRVLCFLVVEVIDSGELSRCVAKPLVD